MPEVNEYCLSGAGGNARSMLSDMMAAGFFYKRIRYIILTFTTRCAHIKLIAPHLIGRDDWVDEGDTDRAQILCWRDTQSV